MAQDALSAEQMAKLAAIVQRELSIAAINGPGPSEAEPSYTARCIGPCVAARVSRLDILGLTIAHDGGTSPRPVRFRGLLFRPDVSISYYGRPVVAVEVKYAFGGNPQDAVAKALGQCVAYSSGGYQHAIGFVVTDAPSVAGSVTSIGAPAGAPRCVLIARLATREGLRPLDSI